ncbi:MAG: ATPase [Azospirillum sp.]|nr:ATPase [Azospirillum sp.]
MARVAEVQARIASLDELKEIMGAMRALAALRVQQAQGALPGIRRFAESVDQALGQALGLLPAGEGAARTRTGRGAILAFTSEHGFAGAYNEHVLDAAWPLVGDGRLVVIGSRGKIKADERGYPLAGWLPMATQLDAVIDTARSAADRLYRLLRDDGIERVTVVYGFSVGGAVWRVETESLLPFDPERHRRTRPEAPLTYLAPLDLFEKLVGEYVFSRLMHAAMEAFASENGARLAAMEAAHENIETKLELLNQQARQQRQEEITTELLDVVTGAVALG